MSIFKYSVPTLPSNGMTVARPRAGFLTPSPLPRFTRSPTLYFGDVENFGQPLPVFKVELKRAVKEASDACLWLKAAGFPQYVQMFEDGQFPINLSKYQVEKDHDFLNQADIDSLIRRLNILNRCADLMEETLAKVDDSEDEVHQRALSDKWHFKRKNKKWSRRPRDHKLSYDLSYSSSEDLLNDSEMETPTEQSPLMLVSELRGSLTGLDRAVKTYSFLPSEDNIPSILVDPSSPALKRSILQEYLDEDGERAVDQVNGTGGGGDQEDDDVHTLEGEGEYVNSFPGGNMDNFATGILDEFDTNLLKLRTQSLPELFSVTSLYGGASTDSLSSNSTSTVSVVESTKGSNSSILDSPRKSYSPSSNHHLHNGKVHTHSPVLNGHAKPPMMEGRSLAEKEDYLEGVAARDRRMNSIDSTGTFESRSSPGDSEREEVSVSPLPTFLERRYMQNELRGSAGDLHRSYSEGNPSATGVVPRQKRLSTSSRGEDVQRGRSKWHSYQQPHTIRQSFKPVRTLIPIEELSVGQISVLRKLSLVKLTALIELYNTKSNIARILKTRKQKIPDIKNKRMFGVPLSVNVSQSGQALPPSIRHAFQHLRDNGGLEVKGLFRRAASKAKVDQLKEVNEANPGNSSYEECSPYDVADMVKLYYRELPEPILTSQLSETLIIIQQNIPSQLRLQALQAVMLLLPDANREALMTLLMFLREVADNSHLNQMDANNLAVCLAPSLFSLSTTLKPTSSLTRRGSFRRNAVSLGLSSTDPASSKEISDSVASSQCLAQMITQARKLFMVAADMLQVCKFTHLESGVPVPCHELGLKRTGRGDHHSYVEESVHTLLREAGRRFKGWVHHDTVQGVEVSYLKPRDSLSLRVWRGVVEVPASSEAVLKTLWKKSFLWDGSVQDTKVVAKLDHCTEVIQYVTASMAPLTDRDHCLLRSWSYDPSSESYVLVSTSVCHPSASLQAGIRATELATGYLMEPLDSKRTRLTYIARVDMKGRSAEYYNRSFGPYLASRIGLAVELFKDQDYLETTV